MNLKIWLAASTVLATAMISPAQAQQASAPQAAEANSGIGDIVVTATRREQRLQEVPLAVTAMSGDTLRTRGISALVDMGAGKVPGLVISPLFGSELGLTMFIRGFGASDASQGTQDLPVALYIDGVNFPRSQGAGLDLVTPERIEVLRGPQGTLFGRNAHSGAVQVVSKKPSGHWEGDFTATVGNYNARGLKGRLDLPEISGFRVQLSGNYRAHDGYQHNPYNPNYANVTLTLDPASHTKFVNQNFNGDMQALDTWGGRIAIERDFGPLNVFYSYDNSIGHDDQGANVLVRSSEVNTIFTGFSPTPLTGVTFTNFSGPGGTAVTFTNPLLDTSKYPNDLTYGNLRVPFTVKSQGHVLNLTYKAADSLTLKSITGLRIVERAGGNSLNAVTSSFMSLSFENMHSRMVSEELQAIYDTTNFNLTAGALYFQEDVRDERTSGLAYNCISPLVQTLPTCSAGTSQAMNAPHSINGFKRSLSTTKAFGLYAQGTYTLGPIDITAGVRYSHDDKKAARVIDRTLGIDEAAGIGTVRRNQFKVSRVDPAFTIKWNVTSDINVYARYAVGFRDGGSSVRSTEFSSFGIDELKSWELGLKSQWLDHRVTLNLAAFHNTVKSQQLSVQTALPNPSITDVFNSPTDRKIKGFEVELAVNPVPGLNVSGTYTYMTSSNILFGYDQANKTGFLPVATFSPTTGLVPDAATVAAHPNSVLILVGALGTPKHSGALNVDYELPLKTGKLVFHTDWSRSSRFINASPEIAKTTISAAGVVAPQPSYNGGASSNRVNARVAYRDIPLGGGARGEIAFWIKNAFNHVDSAFAFVSGLNAVTILQPPRTFGADFRLQF